MDAATVGTRKDHEHAVQHLLTRFRTVRQQSLTLCRPLTVADHELQAADFTSPAKWHLAHTSWFFETFILKNQIGYGCFNERYEYLFNSYYNAVGEQYPRHQRGLMSRPSLDDILVFRHHIDHAIEDWLQTQPDSSQLSLLELGLHHEQQHQELLLTDLLYCWSKNPLAPIYCDRPIGFTPSPKITNQWCSFDGGIHQVGHDNHTFCFDNETPKHQVLLENFKLATLPVSNKDFIEFIEDGGYTSAEHWLSDGWSWVQSQKISAPLYWRWQDEWQQYGLHGWQPVDLNAAVHHVSFYEADAFARWAGARLPSELEWEVAAIITQQNEQHGQFVDTQHFIPQRTPSITVDQHQSTISPAKLTSIPVNNIPHVMFGGVWEWTSSAYQPYPGFQAGKGAVGEYNGKFMCNQMVLKGGSCLTATEHIRTTYRNFFYPQERWQMTGIRLAKR